MKYSALRHLILGLTLCMVNHLAYTQNRVSLMLAGKVANACTITVNPTAKAQLLDLIMGEHHTHIANVIESCNTATGYSVEISSAFAGQLKPVTLNTTPTVYELSYSHEATGNIANTIVANSPSAQFFAQYELLISFPANPLALAELYSDTVSFVISAR